MLLLAGLTMATYVLQVLGTVGIIETIVEFSYAINKIADFTPFENIFFLMSGTFEMAGELYVLGVMAKMMLREDNAPDACELGKQYVKDPIHIYAFSPWEGEEGYDNVLASGAGFAIILSLAPTMFWWLLLTIMVYGARFESDGDEKIMLALAIVSLCSCVFTSSVIGAIYVGGLALPRYLREGYSLLPCLYSVQKVFEVYLLLSRNDRLASDELGVSLILFQLIELSSCAMIVGKYGLVRFFEGRNARTTQVLPLASVQVASAQAPSAQAPSAQAPSAQAPSAQAPSAQAPSAQALSAQAPSAQAPSAQAPSVQVALP